MCGADHGPDHDDPAAARVCDLYHDVCDQLGPAALTRLRAALDDRDRELLWQVAVGVGPEGIGRRLATDADTVRAELTRLTARLEAVS